MARRLNFAWRLFATGFCFSIFGIGGMFMGFLILPLIHLLSRNRRIANRRCQFLVHLSFRLLIAVMRGLRLLSYEMVGRERLHQSDSKLIVSNHPSLIDIVFIVSLMPQAVCAVKKAAWSNPFMAGVMWATGYVPNDDPMRFIDDCVENVQDGQRLVIFPEGTRVEPGKKLRYRAGIAALYSALDLPVTPVVHNSGLCWPKQSFRKYAGTIVIRFLEPINPGLERQEFMTQLEVVMENAADELMAETNPAH